MTVRILLRINKQYSISPDVVERFLGRLMNLFETQEFEIKTMRTKDELVQRLSKLGDSEGGRFKIESPPYGLGYTFATGEIQTSENETIVLLKMYPSMILRIFTYAWLGGTG